MRTLSMVALCSVMVVSAVAEAEAPQGRWASNDNHGTSGTAKVGARFFLEVAVDADGTFRGTWEAYDNCYTSPGPYGIQMTACQRSKKGKPASGRLDAASGEGKIKLEGLGESSFHWKRGSSSKGLAQLEIELPRDWQKQGDPVLYEAVLNPK